MKIIIEKLQQLLKHRTAKDYLWVFGGQTAASFLHLASLSILLALIGHEGNGILLSVQALCYLCGDLTNPFCFQAVIRYFALSRTKEERDNIICQGFVLDIAAGVIGTIVASFLMEPICTWMGYDHTIIRYVWIFLPCVYFRHATTGTAMGILRYLGKFNVNIILYDIQSVLRIILYAAILFFKRNIAALITIEMVLELFYGIGILVAAVIYAGKNGIAYPPKKLPHFQKEFMRFNLLNMASAAADMALGNVSSIIVTRYLGASLLSVFKILEKIGSMISKFTVPFSQVIYPELCRSVSERKYKDLKHFTIKYIMTVGLVSVVVGVVGVLSFPLWRGVFSLDQAFAPEVAAYLLFAMVTCIAVPVHSTHTAMGLMHYNLINVLIINSIYCVLLIPTLMHFSLMGFILLQLLQAVVMMCVKMLQELHSVRKETEYL